MSVRAGRHVALAVAQVLVLAVAACGSDDVRPDLGEPTPTPDASAPPPRTGGGTEARPREDAADAAAPIDPTCTRPSPASTCGVAPQCGCSDAATCDVVGDDAACVPAGKFAQGKPCTATVGCARGLTCVFGVCRPYCANPGGACEAPALGPCVPFANASGAPIAGVGVCRVTCDLRDANGCGGTTAAGTGACYPFDDGSTDCARGGTVALGGTCTVADDCGPALVCVVVGQAQSGTCKKWCRVGQTADCGGATCGGFTPKVFAGGVEHGACP